MKLKKIFVLVTGVVFVSCTVQKNTTYSNYLQNSTPSGKNKIAMREPVIQRNDLLSIKVYSISARPDITDAPYNLPDLTAAGGSAASTGFLVDQSGNIEYPRLGILHVEGQTKNQLADTIKKRLEGELKSPTVIVRFLNYRITILGEVKTPGTFTLPTDRITILEALGLAGDITEYGNKSLVKIARENNGEVEEGTLNLTSDSLFLSPYYRLQQNDVVFVEQNKRKAEQLEQQQQQMTAQRIGIVSGIVSTLAIIYSIIKK